MLSVIVPAFQEELSIRQALGELLNALDGLNREYEVILVSDGNTDGTVTEARNVASPHVIVLHYPKRRGKGFALAHGFRHARGESIVFIDADLDLHPSGIRDLLEILESNGADAVVGSKVHPDSRVFYPKLRRFQSRIFRLIIRALFHLDVSDTQTGLKVFRRALLADVIPRVRSNGFAFDLELLVLANDAGYDIREGPVQLDYQFTTTTGVKAVTNVLRDTIQIARRRARSRDLGDFRTISLERKIALDILPEEAPSSLASK